MSKKFKKFFAGLLAFVMVFAMSAAAAPAAEVKAEEEGYEMFLAIGANTEGGEWNAQYYNGSTDDTANIIPTTAKVKAGDTVTIGITCDTEITKTWFTRPVIAVDGKTFAVDYTINSITVDGEDILPEVNLAAGDAYWAETTGPHTDALCLAGGYNEWGTKYIAESPAGYTELMYNITINAIGDAAELNAPSFDMFLAIGANTEGGEWNAQYYNGSADDTANMKATTAKVKAGDTVTIGVTCDTVITKTWFVRPVIAVNGNEYTVDYTINSITLDGKDILPEVNLAADEKKFWAETTGPHTDALCLAGGYNEWATKYIATSPENYKEFMYNITINSIGPAAGGEVTTVELPEEIETFIAIGAENVAGSWDMSWANEADNASGIVGTVEKVSVGETVTIKLAMPNEVTKTYYFAPTMVVSGVGEMDVTIDSMKFDGEEFIQEVDLTLNPDRGTWWYESTGTYTAEETLRLAGGYNEWADKYLAEVPTGWTELEITYTLNSISPVAPTVSNEIVYEGEVTALLAGTAESADQAWDWTFANGTTDAEGIVGTVATAKAGDTVTVGITYPAPVFHTWWLAPTLVLPEAEDGQDKYLVDYTIDKVTIDGADVTDKLDLTLGEKDSWYEGTENHPVTRTIRLKGGYNEWGDQYIAGDLLKGHTNVEYTITINKIYGVVVEEVEGPKVDKNGAYNAYIGVQTADSWAFRNAWDDATYGKDSTENPDAFNQLSIAETDLGLVKKNGTITDTAITGNGTYTVSLKDFDFVNAAGVAASAMNLLFISTDIPNSGEITVSNAVVKFDGKVVMEFADCVVDPDSKEWLKILFINIWNNELKASYPMDGIIPTQSIEVTFDISGFDYDNTTVVETPEPTATTAPTEAPAEPTATTAPTEAPKATEAPVATVAPTQAPAADVDADAEEGGIAPIAIAAIALLLIGGGAFAVMKGKKKD